MTKPSKISCQCIRMGLRAVDKQLYIDTRYRDGQTIRVKICKICGKETTK